MHFVRIYLTYFDCSRLALLCGKYESNALALRLALGVTDRTIEAYDVLLALLETELALDDDKPGLLYSKSSSLYAILLVDVTESRENREASESIAKQLLAHLSSHQSSDILQSPWQNHVFNSPTSET